MDKAKYTKDYVEVLIQRKKNSLERWTENHSKYTKQNDEHMIPYCRGWINAIEDQMQELELIRDLL